MLKVKVVNKNYPRKQDMENLIFYITQPGKCKMGFYGAQGLYLDNPSGMARQMMNTKKNYEQTEGRMMLHYVVSFSEEMMKLIAPLDALNLGYAIMDMAFKEYQVVFGVHEDTDNLHIHFAVNSTNYCTGRQFSLSEQGFYYMCKNIEDLVANYIASRQQMLV